MVRIRHKQTSEIKEIEITIWLRKTNQDLYDLISIEDVVTLYQYIKKGDSVIKKDLGLVEKAAATESIKNDPDSFVYENYDPIEPPASIGKALQNAISFSPFASYGDKQQVYLKNLEKKPDLIKKSPQNKIPPKKKNNIIKLVKNISLGEWAAIVTIMSFILAIWIYINNNSN